VGQTLGPATATTLDEIATHLSQSGTSVIATVIGFVILLFGASGVFYELQDALNNIWKVTPKPGRGWITIIRERFLSFAAVLGTGFLLLISLIINAGLSAAGAFLNSRDLPGGFFLWQALNSLISFALIAWLFALIFKLLPDVRLGWGDVWHGAVLTAFLFSLGKYLIGLYLGQSTTASVFGATASLVVILIWVYYSAQILLFGAEFTRIYAERYGSHRIVPEDNAVFVTAEARVRQGMVPRKVSEKIP
jgi:membrane protein